MYFSNSSNKVAQTAFHAPYSGSQYANTTHWPMGESNTDSGWYEYRDTGDALTQEGFQVALGQVSLESTSWTEGDALSILQRRIGLLEDIIDGGFEFPTIDFGDPTTFGQTREILLNPVPPPDQNLHAHWTFNSMTTDEDGTRYIPDVSGRKNHATVHDFTANQATFVEHDPASDVINVSGNHSLYSDGDSSTVSSGGIILGVHGDDERTILSDGSKIPVDISQTTGASGGYNKQTWTFWYKPISPVADNERILTRDA